MAVNPTSAIYMLCHFSGLQFQNLLDIISLWTIVLKIKCHSSDRYSGHMQNDSWLFGLGSLRSETGQLSLLRRNISSKVDKCALETSLRNRELTSARFLKFLFLFFSFCFWKRIPLNKSFL